MDKYKHIGEIDMTELSVRESRLYNKQKTLEELAKDLVRKYMTTKEHEVLSKLRHLYHKLHVIDKEQRRIDKMRGIVCKVQAIRDREDIEIFTEGSLIAENYRQKIRRFMQPSAKDLSRKLTKLQLERERWRDLQKEYESLLEESSDEETGIKDLDEDTYADERFHKWLESLNHGHILGSKQISDSTNGASSIEKRIEDIRSKQIFE